MIVTVSGMPGSGKTSLAKYLAKKLRLKYYSTGQFTRMLAERYNMSLLSLSKIAESDVAVDSKIDKMQKKLHGEDNLVIDSRLGFYFLPKAVKIYLSVKPEIAAKRLFKREQEIESNIKTIKQTLDSIMEREESARRRFKRYYGVDIYDKKNYDIFMDTSNMTIAQTNKTILEKIVSLRKGF